MAAMVVNRWLQAGTVLRVMGDWIGCAGRLIYPLRDLLGSVLWLGSYGGDRFYVSRANVSAARGWAGRGAVRLSDW